MHGILLAAKLASGHLLPWDSCGGRCLGDWRSGRHGPFQTKDGLVRGRVNHLSHVLNYLATSETFFGPCESKLTSSREFFCQNSKWRSGRPWIWSAIPWNADPAASIASAPLMSDREKRYCESSADSSQDRHAAHLNVLSQRCSTPEAQEVFGDQDMPASGDHSGNVASFD